MVDFEQVSVSWETAINQHDQSMGSFISYVMKFSRIQTPSPLTQTIAHCMNPCAFHFVDIPLRKKTLEKLIEHTAPLKRSIYLNKIDKTFKTVKH